MNKQCEEHKCTHEHKCACPRPFTLFSFPSEKKDPDLRRSLFLYILMSEQSGLSLLIENVLTTQTGCLKTIQGGCSERFVDKLPTKLNPFPMVNLGYTPVKEPKARPHPDVVCIKKHKPKTRLKSEKFAPAL